MSEVRIETPQRRVDLVEREVDGLRLLYAAGVQAHVLDPLGAALFDSLDGVVPVGELAEDLAAAVEQPQDTATTWLEAFLRDLEARGLLVGSEAPTVAEPTRPRYPAIPPSP